jgi:hypothetical protein
MKGEIMNRRIISSQVQVMKEGGAQRSIRVAGGAAVATPPTVDSFMEKLFKYIPAEVIAFYVFVSGLLNGTTLSSKMVIYWVVVALGMAGAFLWTLRITHDPTKRPAYLQAAISTLAFLVWVFALGGPFTAFSWYDSILGAILLAAFTLFTPFLNPN